MKTLSGIEPQTAAPKPPALPKAEMTIPQAPPLTHAQRMARRDDAAVRRSFAQRHPEMTGGLEGERTREANTAVVLAQTGVNKAQERYDEATKRAATPASSYLTGGASTPSLPYAAGEQARQTREAVERSEPYAQVARLYGELFDAKKILGAAQEQKARLDRERELLEPVSTQTWDQRIRDQYATADLDGRVSETEVRSQKIKAAKGMAQVEQEKARVEMEKAQAELMACNISDLAARQGQGPVSYDEMPEYRRQKRAAYDEAKARYDAWTKRVNDLAKLDHTARNESAFGRLAVDEKLSAIYASAKDVATDRDKVTTVAEYYQTGEGDLEMVQQDLEYLSERYGVTAKDFAAYATAQDGYENGPVMELYKKLDIQTEGLGQDMDQAGYDLEDLTKYEELIQKQQEAAQRAEETAQFAREHSAIATVATVVASPFQVLDLLNMDWGKGKPGDVGYIPPDSSGMTLVNAIQTVRGTVSHDLARSTDWELFGQNVPAFLYNTGMSMADSALAVSTFGTGSVYLMGMNAAVNTAKDVVDNGGTTQQALKLGLAAGVAEVLFEKVSVESLLKPKTASGWREVVSEYVIKQGGIELSEEALTEIANILAEVFVLGADSDYAKAVEGYRDQGASESQAKQKAFFDMLGRVGWAGAGGAISGAGMGGGKAAVDAVSQSGIQSLSNVGRRLIETIQSVGTDTKRTVSVGKTGNRLLNEQDLEDYLSVGERKHVRDLKEAQARTGSSPILTSLGQIKDFIRSALSGEVRDTIKGYGKVGARMTEDLRAAGVDVDGYYLELDSNRIGHLSDHVGDDGDPRNIPLTQEQAENLTSYIDDYDDILDVVRYKDGGVRITLGKKINGHAVVVELVSKGRRSIQPVTAWQNDTEHYLRKYGKEETQAINASHSRKGEESGYKQLASSSSIPQVAPDVNPGESSPASLSRIPELLQKIKSGAREGLERPRWVPEETWAKLKSSLADPTGKELDILADLLDISPELRPFVETALAKALADMEDVAHWESMTPEVRQYFQSDLEEKSAALQWVMDRLAQLEGPEKEPSKQKQDKELTKGTTDGILSKDRGGRKFQSEELFTKHYKKHMKLFGVISFEEYMSRANMLADSPLSDDVVQLVRADGSISKYCFSTNEFVVINLDGTIRTFFMPDNGRRYWQYELDRNK